MLNNHCNIARLCCISTVITRLCKDYSRFALWEISILLFIWWLRTKQEISLSGQGMSDRGSALACVMTGDVSGVPFDAKCFISKRIWSRVV
jgi:hypothetical protein